MKFTEEPCAPAAWERVAAAHVETYPKIQAVTPQPPYQLVVTFDNQMTKVYDCAMLLQNPIFASLTDPVIFQTVQRDAGGYGVIWNDDLDLSEAELWLHGRVITNATEHI